DAPETRACSYQALLCEELDDRLRGVTVIVDLPGVPARRRLVERVDLRLRALLAGAVGLDAEVGQRERLMRLRLRTHDPLQRRVARYVDRVGDGHDCGQPRLDHVVAELRLALDRHLAV